MYFTCPSAQSTWVSTEQNHWRNPRFMHACLVSNLDSSSSGTCSPWSPALLSCGGGGLAVSRPVFRKSAKISTGHAKYMTKQKRYTTVMPSIYYYQSVISRLYLVFSIPMLSIWQTRKDILQLCQEYTIINLLYLSYTSIYHTYFFLDVPWMCWTQSIMMKMII